MSTFSDFSKLEGYVKNLSNLVGDPETLGLAHYVKDRSGRCYLDKEDLFQEGRIWLWQALEKYPEYVERRKKQNESIEDDDLKQKIGGTSTFAYMWLRGMYINLHNSRYRSRVDKECGKSKIDRSTYTSKFEGLRKTQHVDDATKTIVERSEVSKGYYDSSDFQIDFHTILNSLTQEEKDVVNSVFIKKMKIDEVKKIYPLYNVNKIIGIVRKKFSVLRNLDERGRKG